jgi:hypothetical protein
MGGQVQDQALYRLILDLTAHRYDYVRGTGRPGDAPDRYTLAGRPVPRT